MTTLSPLSGSPASIKNEPSFGGSPASAPVAPSTASGAAPTKPKSKPRKRVNTAEKRHQHNAIERQRRETLNGKFLSLARLLPSLATVRRPSKSAIVNGSISHLTYQRNQRLLAAKLLRNVCAQHDALLSEVNEWRKASGYAPKQMSPTWTDEMEEVVAVEKEQFGNFSTMGGDGDDNDNEDDDTNSNDMSLDQANFTAATFGGLITPRSSAELDAASHSHAMFNLAQAQVQAQPQNQVPHAQAQAQAQAQIQAALAVHAAQVLQQQQHQQQQQQQQHNDKRAAAMSAGLWSQDFAFGLANNGNRSSTPGSVLPFNAFVSDSFDASSTSSPAGSAGSAVGGVFTPPTSADMGVYTHTPSPRSTHSVNDEKAQPTSQPAQQAWNPAMFLQQMQTQQQAAHTPPVFTPSNLYGGIGSVFPGMQQAQSMPSQSTSAPQVPSQQTQASLLSAAAASSDAFTQSLLASMFPTQGVSAEQVDQWRKLALSGFAQQPAAPQRVQPIRSDSTMSLNRGLAGMWEQPAVEGF
jgi:hypothetical protein